MPRPSSDIHELREHLFATLRALRDKDRPMEIDRARAVSEVAATLINSARVEVEFMRASGIKDGTGFIGGPPPVDPDALPNGITSITRHALK